MCLQGFPWPQMTQFRSPPHPFVHDLEGRITLQLCSPGASFPGVVGTHTLCSHLIFAQVC